MNTIIRIVKSPLQPDNKQQWDLHYATEGMAGERCMPFEFDKALPEEQCRERATNVFNNTQPMLSE